MSGARFKVKVVSFVFVLNLSSITFHLFLRYYPSGAKVFLLIVILFQGRSDHSEILYGVDEFAVADVYPHVRNPKPSVREENQIPICQIIFVYTLNQFKKLPGIMRQFET